jgi:predicted O-methyltransferase YrrM
MRRCCDARAVAAALTLLLAACLLRTRGPCGRPPPGFVTVYCGSQLTAAVDAATRTQVAVLTSRRTGREQQLGTTQTFFDVAQHTSRVPYPTALVDAALATAAPGEEAAPAILLLGLGGGAVPHLVAHRCARCRLTAVDCAPDALAIARALVQADDGVRTSYLLATAEAYMRDPRTRARSFDVIINDVYDGSVAPPAVHTAAFARAVQQRLMPRGVYLVNVFVPTPDDGRAAAVAATLGGVFRSVTQQRVADSGNVIMLARD